MHICDVCNPRITFLQKGIILPNTYIEMYCTSASTSTLNPRLTVVLLHLECDIFEYEGVLYNKKEKT